MLGSLSAHCPGPGSGNGLPASRLAIACGAARNGFRSTAEKGERTYERYADHLAAALGEFEKLQVEVHTREWRAIV